MLKARTFIPAFTIGAVTAVAAKLTGASNMDAANIGASTALIVGGAMNPGVAGFGAVVIGSHGLTHTPSTQRPRP